MDELSQVWKRYKTTGDPQARETVITRSAYLIKYALGRMAMTLPPSIEYGDLVSAGSIGLLNAVERFDPARNIKFETFALHRIRGSILDYLRSVGPVSRTTRARLRELRDAYRQLEDELGRHPEDGELAGRLGISVEEIYRLMETENTARVLSLNAPRGGGGGDEEGSRLVDTLRDPRAPDTDAEEEELRSILTRALDSLGEQERTVLSLYYYDGLTLKEIARVLRLTESRICQIHGKAVFKLRLQLNKSKNIVTLF